MSCCGTRYRVSKVIINSEYKQQLPKVEMKQDDLILLPIQERKLFRCNFNLSKIIKPEHMIVATIDYTKINAESQYQQLTAPLSSLMVRQQAPIRQNEVQFYLNQKDVIVSKGEIVNSDSDKREIDQREIQLNVIDQGNNNKNQMQKSKIQNNRQKPKQKEMEREMMMA